MFAVSAIMQASLLAMCIVWKLRQRRLNIDDFGHPLDGSNDLTDEVDTVVGEVSLPVDERRLDSDTEDVGEDVPLLAKPHASGRKSGFFRWLRE